jgi:hypothetical protein
VSGFLAGLGQGLSQGGQAFGQTLIHQQQLEAAARQQAMQNMLEQQRIAQTRSYQDQQLGLQREAQERLAGQAEFDQNKFLVGNLPGGTPLSPEVMDSLARTHMSAFARPDMVGDPSKTPVQEGLPNARPGPGGRGLAGSIGNPLADSQPSGRGYSIPTEDSRARTAAMTAMLRSQDTNAKMMQQAQLAAAKNALTLQLGQAKDATDRARIEAQLAAVNVAAGNLQQRQTEFDANQDFRYGVTAPNIDFDNMISQYNAENPRPGATGGGLDINALLAAAQGGAAPPPQGGASPQTQRPKVPSTQPRQPRRKSYADGSVAEEEIIDGKPTGKWVQVKPPSQGPSQ